VATSNPKPPVGSPDWHRVRRENHKEVERRRREAINDGITALAKIVPGCERAKGSILARAVEYIEQLKDTSATNIEKWTLEKLLTDQAINDLTIQVNNLEKEKQQLQQRVAELETEVSDLSGQVVQLQQQQQHQMNDGSSNNTDSIRLSTTAISGSSPLEISSGHHKNDTTSTDNNTDDLTISRSRKHTANDDAVDNNNRLLRKRQHV
jgi:TolA-binding protein